MRVELPTGTVTFLFTDIEGSTRLIDELGEAGYVEALAEHRRLLREALGAWGGVEVDTQGDAFLYAFADARAAFGAAADGQRALALGPVRVRMGLHTGEPVLTAEGYAGRELHRAARIAAAGHGGQVVVSAVTASLVDGELSELGEHRLKDFDEPVALYQLGNEPFPPLKTIANTNLPRPASSFIGREREVAEVVALLRDGARLVTLAGPGGSGKTRLAIEAAGELIGEFRAGVFWVGLAGLRESSLVLRTVAQTLGAAGDLAGHIEERELLLLLDNFEQVVDAGPELASLVEACPNLMVLVTSRELLRVRGELRYEVAPLESADAVRLFCSRARLEEGPEVAELCRRLDDLPLAVELAAARTSVLSPAQMLKRLTERLDLLRGGRDAEQRQQTLRATIEWSYDLLTEDEQELFARLAVFAGGCTLEAAEEVAGAELDLLQSLVEKSLVRRTGERFWMLETVREYALERLKRAAETETLRRRQVKNLIEIAAAAGFGWEATAPERHDLVRAEMANLRAVLAWALEADPQLGLRLMCELEWFWLGTDADEGRRWLAQLLERATEIPDPLRAMALMFYGGFTWYMGDYAEGMRLRDEALEIYRRLGDESMIRYLQVRSSVHLAFHTDETGPARARELCEDGVATFRRDGFRKGEAGALLILGYVARAEGRYEDSLALSLRAERIAAEIGWTWWQAGCFDSAAEAALRLNRPREAERYLRLSLPLAQKIGDRQMITGELALLAWAAALQGDPKRAGVLFGAIEAEAERGRLGQWEKTERDEFAQRLGVISGRELELGIAEGKALTLDQAIAFALRAT